MIIYYTSDGRIYLICWYLCRSYRDGLPLTKTEWVLPHHNRCSRVFAWLFWNSEPYPYGLLDLSLTSVRHPSFQLLNHSVVSQQKRGCLQDHVGSPGHLSARLSPRFLTPPPQRFVKDTNLDYIPSTAERLLCPHMRHFNHVFFE